MNFLFLKPETEEEINMFAKSVFLLQVNRTNLLVKKVIIHLATDEHRINQMNSDYYASLLRNAYKVINI
jgi:hypothetical protein